MKNSKESEENFRRFHEHVQRNLRKSSKRIMKMFNGKNHENVQKEIGGKLQKSV